MQKKHNSTIKINFSSAAIFLKRIENEEMSVLNEKEIQFFSTLSHSQKKREFLTVRSLRNEIYPFEEINYLPSGKPYFANRLEHLSISHSSNFAAIGISDNPIGIDIEEINERILKVEERFLHEDEKQFIQSNTLDLTIAWTIKEALFKLNNREGIIFKDELRILEKLENGIFRCEMLGTNGWESVFTRTIQHENLIISFTFVPNGDDSFKN